jgi:urease beta subunit
VQDPSLYSREKLPGAIIARKGDIVINKGRERVRLRVTNTGDRPVQVGIYSTNEMRKIITNVYRLAHITTSSRLMLPSRLIGAARMENALTFPRAPQSASNQAT